MRGYELESAMVDHLLEINAEVILREGEEDLVEIALDGLRENMILARGIRRDNA